jgi:hypothetical protein
MNRFDEMQFRATVDRALVTVSKILDTTKHPARAADVPHVYDDKYGLVEQATKAALVATANAMEVFGASGAALDGMRNWVKANKVRNPPTSFHTAQLSLVPSRCQFNLCRRSDAHSSRKLCAMKSPRPNT